MHLKFLSMLKFICRPKNINYISKQYILLSMVGICSVNHPLNQPEPTGYSSFASPDVLYSFFFAKAAFLSFI